MAAVGAGGNRVRMTNVLPQKSCIKERFIELTANVVLIVMTPEVFLCLSWFTEELRKSAADDGDDVEQFLFHSLTKRNLAFGKENHLAPRHREKC